MKARSAYAFSGTFAAHASRIFIWRHIKAGVAAAAAAWRDVGGDEKRHFRLAGGHQCTAPSRLRGNKRCVAVGAQGGRAAYQRRGNRRGAGGQALKRISAVRRCSMA